MKITIFIILFSTNLLNAMEERENSSIVPGGSAAGVGRNPFDDVMRAEFPFNDSGYVSFMTETDFTEKGSNTKQPLASQVLKNFRNPFENSTSTLPAVGKQQDEEQEEARDKNTGGIFNRVTQYFTKEAIDIGVDLFLFPVEKSIHGVATVFRYLDRAPKTKIAVACSLVGAGYYVTKNPAAIYKPIRLGKELWWEMSPIARGAIGGISLLSGGWGLGVGSTLLSGFVTVLRIQAVKKDLENFRKSFNNFKQWSEQSATNLREDMKTKVNTITMQIEAKIQGLEERIEESLGKKTNELKLDIDVLKTEIVQTRQRFEQYSIDLATQIGNIQEESHTQSERLGRIESKQQEDSELLQSMKEDLVSLNVKIDGLSVDNIVAVWQEKQRPIMEATKKQYEELRKQVGKLEEILEPISKVEWENASIIRLNSFQEMINSRLSIIENQIKSIEQENAALKTEVALLKEQSAIQQRLLEQMQAQLNRMERTQKRQHEELRKDFGKAANHLAQRIDDSIQNAAAVLFNAAQGNRQPALTASPYHSGQVEEKKEEG